MTCAKEWCSNVVFFRMCRLARHALTSFLGPEGLKSFMPRMHKITKAHLAEFWEGKDEIMAGTQLKRFTFSLAIDLFVSKTEGCPEFHSLTHDIRTFLTGMVQLPLDFPGTKYHKARLARESILHTLDKIMSCRHKVRKLVQLCKLFVIFLWQNCF